MNRRQIIDVVAAKDEIARHHADDVRLHAVEHHCAIRNLRVSIEPPLPEFVTEQHHGCGVIDLIFFCGKHAADERLYSQRIQKVGRKLYTVDLLRGHSVALRAQIALDRFHRAQRFKTAVALLQREVVGHRNAVHSIRMRRRNGTNNGDAIRLAIRKRAPQDGVNQSENRRIQPDPESQRHDHDAGEQRPFHQHTQSEGEVQPQNAHDSS
jgi:hypothetical protein